MLNSWKEIAAYIGKSIRTVQRWERELGLPVRRPNGRRLGIVLADTAELDAWLHSTLLRTADNEIVQLKKRCTSLSEEVADLKLLCAELVFERDSLARAHDQDVTAPTPVPLPH